MWKRILNVACWWVVMGLALGVGPGRCAQQRQALLVGINQYQDDRIRPALRGCEHDAKTLADILSKKFQFSTRVLVNEEATQGNIRQEMALIKERAQPEDAVLFFFSGHAARAQDDNGEEEDGFDETLCPYDANYDNGDKDVRDDELNQWFSGLPTTNVTIVVDSCFAAGLEKAGPSVRAKFNVGRGVPSAEGPTAPVELKRGRFLAACQSNESAKDVQIGQDKAGEPVYTGVFTHFLIQTLQGSPADISYSALIQTVTAQMGNSWGQTPQVYGEDLDQPLFSPTGLDETAQRAAQLLDQPVPTEVSAQTPLIEKPPVQVPEEKEKADQRITELEAQIKEADEAHRKELEAQKADWEKDRQSLTQLEERMTALLAETEALRATKQDETRLDQTQKQIEELQAQNESLRQLLEERTKQQQTEERQAQNKDMQALQEQVSMLVQTMQTVLTQKREEPPPAAAPVVARAAERQLQIDTTRMGTAYVGDQVHLREMDPQTGKAGDILARGRVEEVDGNKATVQITEGSVPPEKPVAGFLAYRVFGNERLVVRIIQTGLLEDPHKGPEFTLGAAKDTGREIPLFDPDPALLQGLRRVLDEKKLPGVQLIGGESAGQEPPPSSTEDLYLAVALDPQGRTVAGLTSLDLQRQQSKYLARRDKLAELRDPLSKDLLTALHHKALRSMTNPGQTYEVKMTLSPQQEVYRPGDKFTLSFTASQDCHVALIDVGTSGEITVLFPDHGFGETGEVKAGQEVILECEVGGPGGLDSIRAIATQQKVDFESLLKDLGAKDTKRINRVGQGVADKPVNTWSTSILTYRIEDFH